VILDPSELAKYLSRCDTRIAAATVTAAGGIVLGIEKVRRFPGVALIVATYGVSGFFAEVQCENAKEGPEIGQQCTGHARQRQNPRAVAAHTRLAADRSVGRQLEAGGGAGGAEVHWQRKQQV
jgi:hypothetical protein